MSGGKYRLDARLGGGGMAEVFVASTLGAEGFSRKVAIKKVLPGFSDNPQFASMFVAEAQISSRLVHPNIVSVTDFDRDPEGRLFLVMEMVEGKDLDALLQTGLLPFGVVIYVITEALRGLGYAHDLPVNSDLRGVVHRDVSPHNVLLSWEGAVKVSDFGIAKAKAASEATASVFIKGKPAYMSPEQANGRPLDGRSDLFAVGVMLWEMLVGTRLFVAEDTRATLAAVLFGQIQRPRSIRPDVPKDLERVAMKLLEREVGARYATADEAITDLLNCQSAPKNGRDELRKVLAERFPHQMPMRQSVVRSLSGQSQTPTNHLSNPAIPSVSAKMSAETGTIMPGDRPNRRGLKIALVLGLTTVAAVITFAVVSTMKKSGPPANAPVAAIAPDAAAAKTVVAPPDAAALDAPSPPDAAPPPDAGVPPDAAVAHVDHAPRKVGRIRVTGAMPAMKVDVDGKYRGEASPMLEIKDVPVGRRTVRLYNPDPDIRHNETQYVDVVENATKEIRPR